MIIVLNSPTNNAPTTAVPTAAARFDAEMHAESLLRRGKTMGKGERSMDATTVYIERPRTG
jgi:hypothetical protein